VWPANGSATRRPLPLGGFLAALRGRPRGLAWALRPHLKGEIRDRVRQLNLGLEDSILFQQLVAIALRAGLDPVDLKLITAAFVFLCLIFPQVLGRVKGWGGRLAVGGARRA